MAKIQEIDKNFKVNCDLPEDVVFYDCLCEPIELKGLYYENGVFSRMPQDYEAKTDNEGVKFLMYNTSGGRIKFATNSPYVAIAVEISEFTVWPHMPHTAHSGVDLYSCERGKKDYYYIKTFMPPIAENSDNTKYAGFVDLEIFDDFKEREILINFPLYNGVKAFKIGIKSGCELYSPVSYKYEKPVYFYGSSITQGGCASRPGNSYMAHLSRWLDFDFVNLGFSGSARGESEMAEYIANKDMSVFVLDYDANAPTNEHLEKTHYPFYKKIREANKDLPIIMLSFPKHRKRPAKANPGDEFTKCYIKSDLTIRETYERAIKEGDKNVYYIDGSKVFGEKDQDACTVDNCHPNDLGFYRMAEAIYPVLKDILDKKQTF